MPPTQRRLDRGHRSADEILQRLGAELRIARRVAGLSQRDLAPAARVSRSQVSRLERGAIRSASVRAYAVLFAMLGYSLSCKAYPDGTPLRDVGHLRLIKRCLAELHARVGYRSEVPTRIRGDLRSWDLELRVDDATCRVEAETVISDVQALDRKIGLKMADDGVDVVILLVADTARNRTALAEARELLAARFPLRTREVMASLRAGRVPHASGIAIL
jgi:transcriptional regulator with XRE-family HTH domain